LKVRRRLIFTLTLLFFGAVVLVVTKRPSDPPQAIISPTKPQAEVEIKPQGVAFRIVDEHGQAFRAGLPVRLTLATAAGPLVRTAETTGQPLILEFPYVRAGTVPYMLRVAGAVSEGTLVRQPGAAVSPLSFKLSPQAVAVTTGRRPALVIHPLDANDNVTDQPIKVAAFYPSGKAVKQLAQVRHLIAWTLLPPPKSVGTLNVSVASGRARGERGELEVLPGFVNTASLSASAGEVPAGDRDPWQLDLMGAQDGFGNEVTDGMAISFAGSGEGFDFFATRPLIQGSLSLTLPNHTAVRRMQLRAMSGQYVSELTTLSTSNPAASTGAPLAGRWVSKSPLVLEVGPIIEYTGALVDDGTEVSVTVLRSGEQPPLLRLRLPLTKGKIHAQLPPLPSEARFVEIGVTGRVARLPIPSPGPLEAHP
jgi:hypothetical protein